MDNITREVARARLYRVWANMKSRCYCTNNSDYKHYGGRGIIVCEEWKNSSLMFMDWAKETGYNGILKLDRINNNGNYEPSNCKWSTYKEQQRNRRSNRMLNYRGETKTLIEWAEIFNLNYDTVKCRLNRGWSVHDALTLPLCPRGRSIQWLLTL